MEFRVPEIPAPFRKNSKVFEHEFRFKAYPKLAWHKVACPALERGNWMNVFINASSRCCTFAYCLNGQVSGLPSEKTDSQSQFAALEYYHDFGILHDIALVVRARMKRQALKFPQRNEGVFCDELVEIMLQRWRHDRKGAAPGAVSFCDNADV